MKINLAFILLFVFIFSCSGTKEPEALDDSFIKNEINSTNKIPSKIPNQIPAPMPLMQAPAPISQYPMNQTYMPKTHQGYYEPEYGISNYGEYNFQNSNQPSAYAPVYNPYYRDDENLNRGIPKPVRSDKR